MCTAVMPHWGLSPPSIVQGWLGAVGAAVTQTVTQTELGLFVG